VKLNLISSRGQFGWQLQLCFFLFGWLLSFSLSVLITRTHVRWCLHLLFLSNWWEWDKDNKGGNRVATAAVHTRVTFDGFLFAILVCHLAVSLSSPWHSSFVFIYGHPRWPLLLSLLLMGSWADETLIFYQFQVIAGTHIIQHTVAEQRGR
jgi:hypothetical protein